jgi:hypothetical protein
VINSSHEQSQAQDQSDPIETYLRGVHISIDTVTNRVNPNSTQQNNDRDPWVKRAAIAAIIYAGFTFVIMIINGFQTWYTRQAIFAANRAWIAPRYMRFNSPLVENGVVDVALSIPNVGREPALAVKYKFDLRGIKYIPQANVPNPEADVPINHTCDNLHTDKASGLVDWPEVSYGSNFIPYAFDDTSENRQIANDALHHMRSMMVQGCIVYRTGGDEHTSHFRFFLRDNERPSVQWNFNSMRTGNEAN